MSDFKLGQQVEVTHKLMRRAHYVPAKGREGQTKEVKVWEPVPLVKPIVGIVVGKRSLADGERWWAGEDVGYIFMAEEHKDAIIVAFDMNKNPIKALVEHVKPNLRFEVEL